LDQYSGDIIPFDLESGRVYKALMEVTIGLTVLQAESRRAAGEPLPKPWPRPHQALIDTGAQHTHIKKDIVERLGLEPISYVEVPSRDPNGRITFGIFYQLHISFGSGPGRDTTVVAGAALGVPHDVLIGTTLLKHCVLYWNGPAAKFTIRMP
jgi:predicted aspartyl protease